MKKLRIGLLFGGRSGEHEVSLASAMSVYKALDKNRYEVSLIGIDKEGRWTLPDAQQMLAQVEKNSMNMKLQSSAQFFAVTPNASEQQLVPIAGGSAQLGPALDLVMPILHGTYGEDGTVQGLLELAQIPYVGSGVLGSALGMDKEVSSRLFEAAGIRTVPSICVRKHEYQSAREAVLNKITKGFSLPFFIKPANAGSSVGVHKVKDKTGLTAAIEDAFQFDTKIIVQKAVAARELEVAVLGNDKPKASIVGEIVPNHEFYSYEAKYLDDNGADLHLPAKDLTPEQVHQVQEWAILAFQTLECKGMARVDFFLDRDTKELFINEINTIPGFTKISMYPKLWQASGLEYPELLDELIRLGLETHEQRRALKTTYDK
jgi:D-alanine-D-alanine ligase